MKVISQRQLRNDNAEILRGIERGEHYTVTRRGVPVARLSPITDEPDLRCVRPAKAPAIFSADERVTSRVATADVLADLRGER